ncbi:MAG TPA: hypothetical protein VKG21_19400 [Casimicrobiaceae bacterium]|nr:hypothetical protein [Casimicrobiaceae bacterium]
MPHWAHPRLVALTAVFVCACATVEVPDEVQLVTLRPGAQAVRIIDVRAIDPRERQQGRGYVRKFLADDAIQPPALDLLASRLGEALPDSYRSRTVELHRLDIGFLLSPNALPTSSDTTLSLPSTTSGGLVAVAVLLGYSLIRAINHGHSDNLAIASIDVWIGENQLTSARTVPIGADMRAAKAMESALASALDELAQQARDLPLRRDREMH